MQVTRSLLMNCNPLGFSSPPFYQVSLLQLTIPKPSISKVYSFSHSKSFSLSTLNHSSMISKSTSNRFRCQDIAKMSEATASIYFCFHYSLVLFFICYKFHPSDSSLVSPSSPNANVVRASLARKLILIPATSPK